MRLVTWNINSARLRQDLLTSLMTEYQPDIVCLQEIKCQTHLFPEAVFRELGYHYQHIIGMKAYNGVAILSKIPFQLKDQHIFCQKEDARHQMVKLETGHCLHNFYVPAGGDIADPSVNDKFAHKLDFLSEMRTLFKSQSDMKAHILVGDLNIAPLETDVWSHKQLLKVVSHTPVEVAALQSVQESGPWHDAVRHIIPETEKLYSWWSYRSRDWEKSDRGRRLDHIWVSQDLVSQIRHAEILKPLRGQEKPSDHAPVMIDLTA